MLWKRDKISVYSLAFIIRLAIAPFFVDKLDYFVFIAVAEDILLNGRGIYFEGSLHNRFNYLPLAYLAILPSMFIYYQLFDENIYLERIILKLPFILGDLFLAFQVGKYTVNGNSTSLRDKIMQKLDGIENYELFILFNPFFIYTSSVKGQFDIIPTIFVFYSLKYMRSQEYFKSGIMIGVSILFKQYGIIICLFQFLFLVFQKQKQFFSYFLGLFVSMFPILAIGAILNFDGMITHSLLFHVNRPPSGYSITIIAYYASFFGLRYLGYSGIAGTISQVVLITGILFLIFVFVFLFWRFYKSDREYQNFVQYTLLAFFFFLLLNKVFYLQYLLVPFTLKIELMSLRSEYFSDTQISWNIMVIPFSIMFRAAGMTPKDTRDLLGEHWLFILWILILVIHFLFTFMTIKLQMKPLKTRKLKLAFIISLIFYCINFVIQQLLENYWVGTGQLDDLIDT